ncbi:uncharacterized protein BJ212DRAFT_1347997 [Suillus subaureus]|uniref:Uncharacterized protein n=1 Tax=Suillus subaureus TaxID=48587 RepID=A0A9P7JE53_9AGAM|nr:uncharacterized protein BJ212DRAFT_1347997 [Suillus subaureus]KAG1817971.1 hypothetical protein BJ212DRAFT_1347997 [Suillus subaureus]
MRIFARRQSPPLVDVITYRLNNRMVYVPPAQSFDKAVALARSAFESDLTEIDKSQISFSLNVLVNGKRSSASISREAWSTVMSHLARYEIIDVHVSGPPPSYQSCNSTKEQHSSSHLSSAGLATLVETEE